MHVTVLYFASLRELRGQSTERIEIADDTTIEALYGELFGPSPPVAAFTCNRQICAGDTVLSDGDEVSFLPPLGGG